MGLLMETAKIVDGILLRDGKFLVEKRRMDEDIDPGLLCIPGGHVDPGETLEDALKREMERNWE
jgi:8-oxo-dGTP pyrophosphatase MutT (NUDIX family)